MNPDGTRTRVLSSTPASTRPRRSMAQSTAAHDASRVGEEIRATKEPTMNIILWILQVALALLYLAGGAFKTFNPDDVAKQITAVPRGGWVAVGVFEVLGAVLLIVPAAAHWMPVLTTLAAALLALETLTLAALYARYSLQIAVTNPLVWAVPMGVMAAFVASGRYSLSPLA
jgi:hypothetical protein